MTLTPLDLSEHDAEDYLGKTIIWMGDEFIIGIHIGSGAERIVHRLVSRLTGAAHFVVKILRNPEHRYWGDQPTDGRFYENISPVVLPVAVMEVLGGKVEIQLAAVTIESFVPDRDLLHKAAADAIKQNDFDQAIYMYRQALQRFPGDRYSLYNCAVLLSSIGKPHDAYPLFSQLLNLDPFDLDSRIAFIKCAAECIPADLAEAILEESALIFPKANDLLRIGATIYLNRGRPEMAIQMIEEMDADGTQELRISAAADLEAKMKAWELINCSMNGNERQYPTLCEMTAAAELYGKDPLISINLALSLSREDAHSQAADILLQQVPRVRFRAAKACLLNAAFRYAMAGDYLQANHMLSQAAEWYHQDSSWPDVHGVADFVLEAGELFIWSQRLHAVALKLLQSVANNVDPNPSLPFINIYTEAAKAHSASKLNADESIHDVYS